MQGSLPLEELCLQLACPCRLEPSGHAALQRTAWAACCLAVPHAALPSSPSQPLSAARIAVPQVMKYKTLTPVTGIDVGMQREWLIGQQLNTLKGEDGKLHGTRCVECLLAGSAPQLPLPVSCDLTRCPGPCGHWHSLGAQAAAGSLQQWPALRG